jgi:quercetin dioxygenase-like cupin family protein
MIEVSTLRIENAAPPKNPQDFSGKVHMQAVGGDRRDWSGWGKQSATRAGPRGRSLHLLASVRRSLHAWAKQSAARAGPRGRSLRLLASVRRSVLEYLSTLEYLSLEPRGVEFRAVFFPAGARTKPHTHDVDQLLHVIEGEGVVATEDERRTIRSGDVVSIPRGRWHWHGAKPATAMCHISLKPEPPGVTHWDVPIGDWERY